MYQNKVLKVTADIRAHFVFKYWSHLCSNSDLCYQQLSPHASQTQVSQSPEFKMAYTKPRARYIGKSKVETKIPDGFSQTDISPKPTTLRIALSSPKVIHILKSSPLPGLMWTHEIESNLYFELGWPNSQVSHGYVRICQEISFKFSRTKFHKI